MRILATVVACTLLCSGCATITRGTTQAWSVQTEPAGASVRLSTGETCITPCTMTKRRKDEFQVTIDKDGYQQVTTRILSSVAGAGAAGMAGNVLFGGIIGVGVDATSGATKDLVPNPLVVKLVPGHTDTPIVLPPPSAPAAPSSTGATDGSRSARLASYGPAARSEFAKMHCERDFKLVSIADGNEVYQAGCDTGKDQMLECNGVSCKPTR